jgi:hypothetical protein
MADIPKDKTPSPKPAHEDAEHNPANEDFLDLCDDLNVPDDIKGRLLQECTPEQLDELIAHCTASSYREKVAALPRLGVAPSEEDKRRAAEEEKQERREMERLYGLGAALTTKAIEEEEEKEEFSPRHRRRLLREMMDDGEASPRQKGPLSSLLPPIPPITDFSD